MEKKAFKLAGSSSFNQKRDVLRFQNSSLCYRKIGCFLLNTVRSSSLDSHWNFRDLIGKHQVLHQKSSKDLYLPGNTRNTSRKWTPWWNMFSNIFDILAYTLRFLSSTKNRRFMNDIVWINRILCPMTSKVKPWTCTPNPNLQEPPNEPPNLQSMNLYL